MNEPGFNISPQSLDNAVQAATRAFRGTKNLDMSWDARVRAAIVNAAYELTKEKDEAMLSATKHIYLCWLGHYFFDPDWYKGKPLEACCPTCAAVSERDEARRQAATTNSLMQDDLGDLLRALELSDAARPQSPHTVMQEAIREADRLRQDLTRTERSWYEVTRRLDEIHYLLRNHFSADTDVCQDRGVKWPCHVARAFGYRNED